MIGSYLFNMLLSFYFCASAEPKSADLGNQGQTEEVLFNQRHEGAVDCKQPGGSLWRI